MIQQLLKTESLARQSRFLEDYALLHQNNLLLTDIAIGNSVKSWYLIQGPFTYPKPNHMGIICYEAEETTGLGPLEHMERAVTCSSIS